MRGVRALLLAALAAGSAGCISVGLAGDGTQPEMRFHTLEAPILPKTGDPASPHSVAVARLSARERHDVRVVKRLPDRTVRFLDFERWADSPDEAVSVAIRESLAVSGTFRSVSDAADGHPVTHSLDGHLLAFELIPSESGPWKARLAVRLTLVPVRSDPAQGGEGHHTGRYEATRELPDAGTEMKAAPITNLKSQSHDRTLDFMDQSWSGGPGHDACSNSGPKFPESQCFGWH